MSGIFRLHMGHEPTCACCAVSRPKWRSRRRNGRTRSITESARRGRRRMAGGAQWDDAGQPVPTDALKVAPSPTLDALAKMVRERFVGVRQAFVKRPR